MIVSVDDVRAIRDIAVNIPNAKLYPIIEEAEKHDILPEIGACRYREIDEHPKDPKWTLLLDGGYYGEGKDVCYFRGLRVTIAYFAAARAVWQNGVQFTAYGMRNLNGENSTQASTEDMQRLSSMLRRLGNTCLADVKKYLQVCCRRTPSNTTARKRYITVHRKKV